MRKKIEINRRQAAVALAAVGFGADMRAQSNANLGTDNSVVHAYTDQDSYSPGDMMKLHLSAEGFAAYPVFTTWRLYDLFDNRVRASGQASIAASYPHVVAGDQNWPVAITVQLPSNLESGCYYFSFDKGKTNKYPVFVRENWANRAEILVIIPTATFQAYNNFGGKSSYPFNSKGIKDTEPTLYSLNRPHAYNWFLEDATSETISGQTNWFDSEWYVKKTSFERRWLNILYLTNGYAVV